MARLVVIALFLTVLVKVLVDRNSCLEQGMQYKYIRSVDGEPLVGVCSTVDVVDAFD